MNIRLAAAIFGAALALNAQRSADPPAVRTAPARRANPEVQQAPEKDTPPGSVTGQVVNAATGEPLKKVTLLLVPAQSRQAPSVPWSATTDASGQFAIKDVKPGAYMLMGERTGFVRASYGARSSVQQGSTLTILSGQELKGISLRMQPHAVITGRIVDEDGEPMAHVQVQAMTHRYFQGRRQLVQNGGGSTNDLGEYRIFGLAPGKYYISATHRQTGMYGPGGAVHTNPNQPEEDYAPTYYPGMNDPAAAVPIVIAAGQPMGNVDMKLRKVPTVRVRGHVVGGGNRGRSMVMLQPRDSLFAGMFARNMSGMQGQDGKFEIRSVIPGSYWLMAQSAEDGQRLMARVPLKVGNSTVEGVEVVLKPGMDVSGTVATEGQTKIELGQINVSMMAKEMGGFMPGGGGARVKDDGTFVIRGIFPDNYRVSVFAGGQQFYLKTVMAGQQEAKNGEISVVEGAPPVLSLVVSSAAGQVNGSVVNDKKEPAQGSTVVLIPSADRREQAQLFKSVTVDQYGKFSMSGIAPGDYKLLAWENIETGAWQDPEFLARFETSGKSLTIKENDSVTAEVEALKGDVAGVQ